MSEKQKAVLSLVLYIIGIGILWYKLGWLVAVGVFVLIWGNNINLNFHFTSKFKRK